MHSNILEIAFIFKTLINVSIHSLILTIIVKSFNCLFVVEKLSQGGQGVKMPTICLYYHHVVVVVLVVFLG